MISTTYEAQENKNILCLPPKNNLKKRCLVGVSKLSQHSMIDKYTKKTFLKVSRLHEILPKHLSVTGCCAIIKTIGSSFFDAIGNIYQSNVPNVS